MTEISATSAFLMLSKFFNESVVNFVDFAEILFSYKNPMSMVSTVHWIPLQRVRFQQAPDFSAADCTKTSPRNHVNAKKSIGTMEFPLLLPFPLFVSFIPELKNINSK